MTDTAWYYKSALVYDIGTMGGWFYRTPRRVAIEQLRLHNNANVFDIFCGTGFNFPLLKQHTGPDSHILAVDGAGKMLQQAQRRASRIGLQHGQVDFLEANLATDNGIRRLCHAIHQQRPRHFLFTLGLICLPNWRQLCAEVIAAAPPGARFCIMDVHSPQLTLGARLINWVGAADCRRPVWEELERRCEGFEQRSFRPFKFLNVSAIVASANKPM